MWPQVCLPSLRSWFFHLEGPRVYFLSQTKAIRCVSVCSRSSAVEEAAGPFSRPHLACGAPACGLPPGLPSASAQS